MEREITRAMLTFRDFITGFRKLDIDHSGPVIVHASLSAFSEVHGGAETVVGAILATFNSVIMPVFTLKTMVIPETGPENNGVVYGSGKDANRMAEFFQPDMPADRLMGRVAEAFRQYPKAHRSSHPILSFTGVNADQALEAQLIAEPLAPIRVLTENNGWVLLLGVGNSVNTSIHYAESLAGRKQFMRWALTQQGILECPGYPGCSDGFQALDLHLDGVTRRVVIGSAMVQAILLVDLVEIVKTWLAADHFMLLCQRSSCERCNAVRATLQT
jgi:aminoglycoside 3-N-acetyltransferase